jgi:mannobiose 2-epimerase
MKYAPDLENGGFYGAVNNEMQIQNEVERSAVLCGRILWTFSTAARKLEDPAYLQTANWAYEYLTSRFWDQQDKGVFWSLDQYGQPHNDRKHTYAQAFSIYGLSAYYRANGDQQCLALAQEIFRLVDAHSFDSEYGGNIECRARDWSPLQDMRLSGKELNSAKSMNTLLHLAEAYAALAQIWPDPTLLDRLSGLVNTFLDHVIDPVSGHQHLFFDASWNSLSDSISYGHDIETSWLLEDCAKALPDPALLARTQANAVFMAQVVYDQALGADGSILYEATPDGEKNEARHWWAHAEAMVGFYNAYQISGQNHFKQATQRVWKYVQQRFIDPQGHDWIKVIDKDGLPIPSYPRIGPWECPYHHSRMCFELSDRLMH